MGDVIILENVRNVRNVRQPGAVRVTSPQEAGSEGFLTLVDRRVAARAAPVTFVALPVDGFCRTTAVGGFLGVSIGVVAVGTAGGLGVAGVTGAVARTAGAGLTRNIPGEDSGIAGATSVVVDMSGLTVSG